jgi:integrase/recombinase XerD
MNHTSSGSSGNHSSPGSSDSAFRSGPLPLSKALIGFTNAKLAEGLSQRTVDSYLEDLHKWVERTGDREIGKVTGADISAYLAWLRTEYIPHRFSGKTHPLSPKTIRNTWIAMSALFHWAERELVLPSPMREVRAPHSPRPPVPELTREEVERMLKACTYTREAVSPIRRSFVTRRPTASRDIALLLVLLDTGIRASELCALKVEDVDLKTGKVEIKHGVEGGAKGSKGRAVYLGKASRRALWHYLSGREDGQDGEAPLFIVRNGRLMRPSTLRHLIIGLGQKVGVPKAYPHKLRHTFAITYLRSGGDVFTLQQILGHASLDTVRIYARIAQSDVAQAHRKASPVDNWRL